MTLQWPEAIEARNEDRRLYESSYVCRPAIVEKSSSYSETSTASSTSLTTESQRYSRLLQLRLRKRANQKNQGDLKLCRVCLLVDCALKSHREYVSGQKEKPWSVPSRPSSLRFIIYASVPTHDIDAFCNLPIDNAGGDTVRLFQDFFTRQGSTLDQTPRKLAFDSAYLPFLMRQALSDAATCHSCVAMAATYSAIHGQNLRKPDDSLSAIYNTAMRALSAQLIREKARPKSTTVMAAVNLVMAQAIGMGDITALEVHRIGIKSFVTSWGGIHNFEPQMVALIIWTDYWATLFTGRPPLYTETLTSVEIQLSNPPPQHYGPAFDEPRMLEIIEPTLLRNCLATSRLIEIVEDKVHKTCTAARWQYFIYKRDCLATRNATVHSGLYHQGSKAECISLTMNLILLLVLRMVPWRSPANELCCQIQAALTTSGAGYTFWYTDMDVLLYVLFVVMAAAEHWDNRYWALDLLLQTLCVKYGEDQKDWAHNWQDQEFFNLKRFAWSEVFLAESFHYTCRELEDVLSD